MDSIFIKYLDNKLRLFLSVLFIIASFTINAQFYNGSQLKFGKNRVQYREFLWNYYNFDNFDVYFYRNGKELAHYTAKYATEQIPLIEQQLDATVDDKMQFLVFNDLSDLKQSNLGLMSEENYNTGGITYILGRKIFLYFNGTYTDFEKQIRAGISKVVFNEMMFGGSVGSQIKNTALYNLPQWYQHGFISYMSDNWNPDIDNQVKDLVLYGKYKNFNQLTGNKAVYAGHSLWKFIADNFGEKAVPNVVQMTRITRSVENGFLYVLGLSFKNLVKEWFAYYQNFYNQDGSDELLPENPMLKRYKGDRVYYQVKIDPAGRYISYVTNEIGLYKIYIYDDIEKKRKRIKTMGYRLDEKTDYSYPILAWHPSGKILAYMVERKGEIYLYFYNIEEKKSSKIILYSFEKINDFAYSPDGRKLIMSAVQKGQSDIFIFNLGSGSHEQLTDDIWDDIQARFIDGEKRIVFSSNRTNDTLIIKPQNIPVNLPEQYDLWVYEYQRQDDILRRVTSTPFANERQPMPYENGFITYLSDENGIYNRYLASFDSMISYVDTITHYKYFSKSFAITNYSRNILEQDASAQAGKTADVIFYDQRYRIFTEEMLPPDMIPHETLHNTSYMDDVLQKQQAELEEEENGEVKKTPKKARKRFYNVYEGDVIIIDKSDKINIDEYVFDKQSFIKLGYDSTTADLIEIEKEKFRMPKQRLYRVEYFMNELTTQIDFSFLNSTYQPFSGGGQPVFLNPGFNALFKIGLTDLLEDYRIVGGVRLNVNLINNEYMVSFSNMKKRVDKEIVFHRVTVEDIGYYSIIRNHSHEVYYVLSYPFNPVLAFKTTAMYRNDAAVFLSTDQYNMKRKTEYRNWVSLKGELVFDNTRSLGLNLYKGTRYKIFGEYYQLINERGQDLVVLGFDFRNYKRVHRTLIWANRFAGSTSFGNNKLIYYMGGVDNWLAPKFDRGTPIDYSQNYAYQTLATNMRGFKQNIRNGNSFILFNTELRIPVFRYLFNRPIKSDFLNNFQAVTFGDIGTAWTGWDPYSEDNSLFTRKIRSGSLYIEVQEQRDPVIAGFGWGLRTRLLGYFLRGDMAWGVEDGSIIKKPIIYVSLSLDF